MSNGVELQEDSYRTRDSKIVSQRSSGVFRPKQAPALEFWDYQRSKIFVGARHVGGGQHKLVARLRRMSRFHLVGHLGWVADENRKFPQRAPSRRLNKIAHRGIIGAALLDYPVQEPAKPSH